MDTLPRGVLESNLSTLKKKVRDTKGDLNTLNRQKELLFAKKKQMWDDLAPAIQKIKQVKKELDQSTAKQNSFKAERDKCNARCKELITKAKELHKEKLAIFKKHNLKGDPQKIQEMIDRLETKVETEVLTIDQEKKVMAKIKDLKKKRKEHDGIKDILTNLEKLSKEIDAVKKRADEFHQKLRDELKRKKDNYGQFIALSKIINQEKAVQESTFKDFLDIKRQFLQKNKELKQELVQVSTITTQIKEGNIAKATHKQRKNERLLEEKEKAVEEKLKKRKKLTTEDLLVFQQKK